VSVVADPPAQVGSAHPVMPSARKLPPEVRRKRLLRAMGDHAVAITIAVMFTLPFVFVILTSLMTTRQALTTDLWPHPFQWDNYVKVFREAPILRYAWNTVVYATLATIGVVVSCVPVAYALSRMRWRGRQLVFLVVIATMMLPSQVTIVPLYIIFVRLGWIGTLKPLIIPTFFGDAFSIFLLRQFFLTIPQELVDAAKVDGANEFQIMWHVVAKLAKPAIAAVALFQFLYAWNDFFNPLLYGGSNQNIWTLSVGLSQFTQIHRGVLWNLQMAASVMFMLPVIILFLFAQKVFIEGVTLTGVKG
jgi:multiple sugar transport system permease protein